MKLQPDSNGLVDLAVGITGALVLEDTLTTAVIISLLSDRRAALDDELPEAVPAQAMIPPDRRGWCGDALAQVPGDRIGSRWWLLIREKQTEATRQKAIDFTREALQWLVDDGQAVSVEIDARWISMGRLDVNIGIFQPNGSRFSTAMALSNTGISTIPLNAQRDNLGNLVLDGQGHYIIVNPPPE